MFKVNTAALGEYDVAVCGGGIAGVCAAVSAASDSFNDDFAFSARSTNAANSRCRARGGRGIFNRAIVC